MRLNNDPVTEDVTAGTALEWLKMKCQRMWSVLSSTKFLISAITTLSTISGLLLLSLGILIVVMCSTYFSFVEDTFYVITGFVIATAFIIFFTALLGFHGVTRKKYHFVVVYVTLLVVILLIEISITAVGFVLEDNVWRGNVILYKMYDDMKYERGRNKWDYDQGTWNKMQMGLECCGFNNLHDWGTDIPLSCCPSFIRNYPPFRCTSANSYYYVGCEQRLKWLLADYTFAIGVTTATVTCLQVIIIAVAVYIAYRLKPQQETPYKGLLDSPMDQASKASYHSQYQAIPGQNVCGSHSNDI